MSTYLHKIACMQHWELGKDESRACVSDITVSDSMIKNSDNGVRIKTWQGGSGSVSKVTFDNIWMEPVQNPIIIDQYYCLHKKCPNQTSALMYWTSSTQTYTRQVRHGQPESTSLFVERISGKYRSPSCSGAVLNTIMKRKVFWNIYIFYKVTGKILQLIKSTHIYFWLVGKKKKKLCKYVGYILYSALNFVIRESIMYPSSYVLYTSTCNDELEEFQNPYLYIELIFLVC